MTPIVQGILAVGVVSLISLIGVTTLSLNMALVRRVLFLLISLAAGALLGDAFIHLLPEAFSEAEPVLVSLFVLAGILVFFVLEKFLHWHHSHGEEEYADNHAAIHPLGHLVLASDAAHNFIDGLVIGAAFMVSTELGIATTLAIALHEIPQEISDFGLLIHSGFSRMKALWMNFFSSLTAFLGLGVAFWAGSAHEAFVPLVAAFAAGTFIYIALADLVPELQKTPEGKRSFWQFVMIIIGVALMCLLLLVEA